MFAAYITVGVFRSMTRVIKFLVETDVGEDGRE